METAFGVEVEDAALLIANPAEKFAGVEIVAVILEPLATADVLAEDEVLAARGLILRPADAVEVAECWELALSEKTRPTVMALSRQAVPTIRGASKDNLCAKGAYVLSEPAKGKAKAVIVATGSEVQLALAAQKLLADEGVKVRVVSMPSTNVFDRQDKDYKKSVLPKGLPRVAVEMGVTDFWWKYGVDAVVGIDTFGESAPAPVLFKHFGFTPENVAATVKAVLKKK